MAQACSHIWDVIVVGAGAAGLQAASYAADRGARVLLLEGGDNIGGTLHVSGGQISAAGTKLQQVRGIEDTAEEHFKDILSITNGNVDRALSRLAVENAADTVDAILELGPELYPDMPIVTNIHEPYSKPRTYWGPELGKGLLRVIVPWFEKRRGSGVTLEYGASVIGLEQDSDGKVTGVVAQRGGDNQRFQSKNVVLATGGFAANQKLFPCLMQGHTLYQGAMDHCTGGGLLMGIGAGGYVQGSDRFQVMFGGIREGMGQSHKYYGGCETIPQNRLPWEIYVNANGQRFVREDEPSIDARERALMAQPELRFWILFDENIRARAPRLVPDWSDIEFKKAIEQHPDFYRAESVDELAEEIRVDSKALKVTIQDYNNSQRAQKDHLGRVHMPAPIGQAPYYVIANYGVSYLSFAGLAVNTELQVITVSGKPIPGLYAAGEIVGGGQTMGQGYCGGMTLTPAFTFGRLLGQHILEW